MKCVAKEKIRRCQRGFTLMEALIVVAGMALLAGLLLPQLNGGRRRSGRGSISCVSNQKQIALAFRIWSNDHEEKFPWEVSISRGGTVPDEGQVGRDFGSFPTAFLAISNELWVPKVLICPFEQVKQKALTFQPGQADSFGGSNGKNPTSQNVSYALGWEAQEDKLGTILMMDSHVVGTEVGVGTVNHADVRVVTGKVNSVGKVELDQKLSWIKGYHQDKGNISLADGSAHQVSSEQLGEFFARPMEAMRNSQAPVSSGKKLSVRILVGH